MSLDDHEVGRLLRQWEALQRAKRKDAANGGVPKQEHER